MMREICKLAGIQVAKNAVVDKVGGVAAVKVYTWWKDRD